MLRAKPVLEEEGPNEGLPLHFGLPTREQEALVQGRGVTFLGEVGTVTITGTDRLSWITSLSTQMVDDLVPGVGQEILFLDAQGRIEFQAAMIDDGSTAWLFTANQEAANLAQFLQSMQFMLDVEVTDRTGDFAGFLTANEGEGTPLLEGDEHPVLVWNDPWPGPVAGGAQYFQGDHPGEETRFRLYVVRTEDKDSFYSALQKSVAARSADAGRVRGDLVPVGLLAAEAARIAAWRPLLTAEGDERLLPAEADWLRTAVRSSSGCYRGQESVARILNLGKPPRRLVFLQLDGSVGELPKKGDTVELAGEEVGVVTSAGQDYIMGPIALALVKRNLDPDEQLNIGMVAASQETIVPVDGRSDHAPSERPGLGLRKLGGPSGSRGGSGGLSSGLR